MKHKFFIVGPMGSGKSELKKCLAAELQARGQTNVASECSEFLIGALAEIYYAGTSPEQIERFKEFLRWHKAGYRPSLLALGERLTDADPGYLVRQCLNADIVAGVRRASEAHSLYDNKKQSGNMVNQVHEIAFTAALQGHHWIYIERAGYEVGSDKFDADFFRQFCMFHLINTGDLKGLEQWTKDFVDQVLK